MKSLEDPDGGWSRGVHCHDYECRVLTKIEDSVAYNRSHGHIYDRSAININVLPDSDPQVSVPRRQVVCARTHKQSPGSAG